MRSFIIAVVIAVLISAFCIFNSVILQKEFGKMAKILDEFPEYNDVYDTGLSEKLKDVQDGILPYLYLTIPRNTVNELTELIAETLTYFHSQDTPAYNASLTRLKIRVCELGQYEKLSKH